MTGVVRDDGEGAQKKSRPSGRDSLFPVLRALPVLPYRFLFGKAIGVNDSVLFDREGLELADGGGSSEKLFGRRRMVQLREGKF